MSLKHGLLGLLNYEPMTGYELNKTFENSLNYFWQAQKSQIYRELNSMEKKGWVEFKIIYQDNKPNKKQYTLTNEGIQELKNWLNEPDISKDLIIRNVFLMKIFFSGVNNYDENIKLLETFKNECKINIDSLKSVDSSIDCCNDFISDDLTEVYWKATANFGKDYWEMSLKWADDTIDLLKKVHSNILSKNELKKSKEEKSKSKKRKKFNERYKKNIK